MKSPNLRFLLSLGSTKMVVLQDQQDTHIYTRQQDSTARQKHPIVPQHIAEALSCK